MGTSSDSPPGDQGCTLCPSDASGEPGGPGLAGGKCLERKAFVKKLHACGSWSSPIGSADLVQGALRLAAPRLDGDRIFWLEGRPSEGGRQVVMVADLPASRRTPVSNLSLSNLCEATPPGVNVRTRVHEYGGGEYTTWRDRVFFVDDADGRVYGGRIAGPVTPLVPKGSQYADLVVSPDGAWVFAIEERPREGMEPENRLISISIGERLSCGRGRGDGDPHRRRGGTRFLCVADRRAEFRRRGLACLGSPQYALERHGTRAYRVGRGGASRRISARRWKPNGVPFPASICSGRHALRRQRSVWMVESVSAWGE